MSYAVVQTLAHTSLYTYCRMKSYCRIELLDQSLGAFQNSNSYYHMLQKNVMLRLCESNAVL